MMPSELKEDPPAGRREVRGDDSDSRSKALHEACEPDTPAKDGESIDKQLQHDTPRVTVDNLPTGLKVVQLKPPDDTSSLTELNEGILYPSAGDQVVLLHRIQDIKTGKILEESTIEKPKTILLGDIKETIGLTTSLSHVALGEKAEVTIPQTLECIDTSGVIVSCPGPIDGSGPELKYTIEVLAIIPGHGPYLQQPVLSETAMSLDGDLQVDSSHIDWQLMPKQPPGWLASHLQINWKVPIRVARSAFRGSKQ